MNQANQRYRNQQQRYSLTRGGQQNQQTGQPGQRGPRYRLGEGNFNNYANQAPVQLVKPRQPRFHVKSTYINRTGYKQPTQFNKAVQFLERHHVGHLEQQQRQSSQRQSQVQFQARHQLQFVEKRQLDLSEPVRCDPAKAVASVWQTLGRNICQWLQRPNGQFLLSLQSLSSMGHAEIACLLTATHLYKQPHDEMRGLLDMSDAVQELLNYFQLEEGKPAHFIPHQMAPLPRELPMPPTHWLNKSGHSVKE